MVAALNRAAKASVVLETGFFAIECMSGANVALCILIKINC